MGSPIDLTGQRFGAMIAMRLVSRGRQHSYWQCRCDCGQRSVVTLNNLRRGNTTSCGCLGSRSTIAARTTTHGASIGKWRTNKSAPGYASWCRMRSFARGKGISVAPEWTDFANFVRDLGRPPDVGWLKRLDRTKGYGPTNCCWRQGHARHSS